MSDAWAHYFMPFKAYHHVLACTWLAHHILTASWLCIHVQSQSMVEGGHLAIYQLYPADCTTPVYDYHVDMLMCEQVLLVLAV